MKPLILKFRRSLNIGLLLLAVILALGSCKKDEDDSPESYLKFKADKDYQLSFPQDTASLYSNTTTYLHFSKYNWTSATVEDIFMDMGFDGPVSAGVHKLSYANVEIGNKYYSISTNPFNYPYSLKNGTINIESLDTQTKTAKGTFTFEVGSINVYTNTGYAAQPISQPVISGSFKFKY